jgi:dipeptidyl aminopeptidase/acylaminoacyl peptidase
MKRILFVAMFVSVVVTVDAQKKSAPVPAQKKPLSAAVYDGWKEIPWKGITPDGSFAAITVNPQDGDGKTVFIGLRTGTQDSVKRASNVFLTWDSRYAIFKISPPQALVKELRRQKKKKEELPKDSLGIYSFITRKTVKIADVRSFKIPEKAGGWVAYSLEAKKEEKAKAGEGAKAEEPKSKKKPKRNTDENGYTLVLRDLSGDKEVRYDFVKDYLFAKNGSGLLFTSTGNDSTLKAGVYWHGIADGKLVALHQGKSKFSYKGLSISDDGLQSAFLLDTDTSKAQIRHHRLLVWKQGDAVARQLDVENSLALPMNWTVSENYTPLFSKDGNKLFFGSAPPPVVKDTTALPEEIVSVEVWGGRDEYIYPQQNRQLDAERKRSYTAVIDLPAKTIFQMASIDVPRIEHGDEGNASIALGETNKPYRDMIVWDTDTYYDFYIYDLNTRMRKQVATKAKARASLSPKAKFVYWFSLPDTSWFVYSVGSDRTDKMVPPVKVRFADEEDDHPDFPNAYGSAGWTTNDERLLLYDRYDIWSFDPEGRQPAVNLTNGRAQKIVFRYLRLDPEQRSIDPTKEMLLSAFDENSKASGYYKLSLKDGKLTKLVMGDYRFAGTVKARNADQLLFTRETFREFPDVWTSDMTMTAPKKLTEVNPQMKNYSWGNVDLVSWRSLDNVPLNGMLYKPEGFDPKKKYPMIVYFYEKESENLHQHVPPTPLRSAINRTTYVSDGYLVFIPDIVYKIGFPGESAYNCIMPGVTSLIAKGFVDEKNVGIQGHSWGGYQTAFILTRTNLFKAAEAGAIVANMISAYGGIRWETGLSRMFQYEHTQSRIGGTLWEKPMHYLENSPIFFADKIQTPLLLMHNDADGAVPWYQGIEMYMAMRRLGKDVWMLNYNGEPHWPVKRENRMDFQVRMKGFFDHYLKGDPIPVWMKDGVPAIEKGVKTGY